MPVLPFNTAFTLSSLAVGLPHLGYMLCFVCGERHDRLGSIQGAIGEEIRHRIRARLVECVTAFESTDTQDIFCGGVNMPSTVITFFRRLHFITSLALFHAFQ